MITEKKCPRCNTIKPISEFGRDCNNKNGISCYCLNCGRARVREYWLRKHNKPLNTQYKPYCRANRTLGAKRIDDGYVSVNVGNGKWRSEHRIVMEQFLGRPLQTTEQIHHINGDKTDNRLANLFILDVRTHSRNHFILYREIAKLTWQLKWISRGNEELKKQVRILQWQIQELNQLNMRVQKEVR